MSLTCTQLKRTLRQLRQVELTLHFGRAPAPDHLPHSPWPCVVPRSGCATTARSFRSASDRLATTVHPLTMPFSIVIIDAYIVCISGESFQHVVALRHPWPADRVSPLVQGQ